MTCPRRVLLFSALLLLLHSLPCHAHTVAEAMAEAANAFVASLTPEQRAKAVFEFKADERLNWHFVPRARQGLPFREITDAQRPLAHALLLSALSHQGYTKATNIMQTVELILRELENNAARRDPGLYYMTIFGSPTNSPWGWRIEGHHLSLNFTINGDQVLAVTPAFMGSNPARVPRGPKEGFRALAGEEDLGRQLVKSLSEEQRKTAVFSATAPNDIITGASRKASRLDPPGIAAAQLNPSQKDTLLTLIKEYVFRYRTEIAEADLKKIQAAGFDKIQFAWAGGLEVGERHYYRVQGPTFLLEYDNTQNNGNHIHTVWRDFENDFGEDLLRKHYEQVPHPH